MTLIVACGLKREAKIIAGAGADIRIVAGGGDAQRLEQELDNLSELFPGPILSCGIAGALLESLEPGDLVVDGDQNMVMRLRLALPEARPGPILGSDVIVARSAMKLALAEGTGAIAADMESHIAARVAARRNLPFVALRAISDKARDDLPPAALVGMKPDGGMALGAVLASLARQPAQLPTLIRTGLHAERAFIALERAMKALSRLKLNDSF